MVFDFDSKLYNISTVSARFFNVYGDRQPTTGTYATVVGIFERQWQNNESLTITGNGEQRRDFTHVYDICEGLKCLSKGNHTGEIYNLGTGINYSINEVYQMFRERFGVDFINIEDQSGNYRVTLRENDDSLDMLGWKPTNNLRDYIFSLDKDYYENKLCYNGL